MTPTERAPDGGAAPYYSDDRATVYVGDCRDVLPHLAPADTCLTDPPYGLAFMGKGWDRGVPGREFWEAVAGAVKPGASLLAFGGTRTWHRLACAVEDAGWEIRDCLMWLYGTGFPKSLDVSKALDRAAGAERYAQDAWSRANKGSVLSPEALTEDAETWNGWGTALKPAWEPIVLAMRPLDGTFAENALRHGVAGLNIDGARIAAGPGDYDHPGNDLPHTRRGREDWRMPDQQAPPNPSGRWPANLLLDESSAELLDAQAGDLRSGGYPPEGGLRSRCSTYGEPNERGPERFGSSAGGASRFFYTAKASRAERGDGNTHPTVKPLDLLRYLCRLTATPTGGVVLDPFMGSGSTLIAAIREGRRAIGIELSEEYAEIAVRRIQAEPLTLDFGGAA